MSNLSLDNNKTESSLEPIKMSWITDFKLVCPDRDILVVRECLVKASKPFSVILEDKEANEFVVEWKSAPIIEVMKVIHSFDEVPTHAINGITMKRSNFEVECDIIKFCFKYDIEPLLTALKTKMISTISYGGYNPRWMKFFHQYKNGDETEPFEAQINAMRLADINTVRIDDYLKRNGHMDDVIADYEFIIKGLALALRDAQSRGYSRMIKLEDISKFSSISKDELNYCENCHQYHN